MKKLFPLIFVSAVLASCSFLDVVPEGEATFDDLFATQIQCDEYVCSMYSDQYVLCRSHLQYTLELGGADADNYYVEGATLYKWKSLIFDDEETPSNSHYRFWSQTPLHTPTGAKIVYPWTGIRVGYDIIENADNVPDATEDQKNMWKGEAYAMIAYQHLSLLEYYGPIPIVDHKLSVNEDINTPRQPYLDCVQFISDYFDKAAELLPKTQSSAYYGRFTKAAALAFKARAWIMAASPQINGNSEMYGNFVNPDGTFLIPQQYDPELWKKAMDAADEAIQMAVESGFKLYTTASSGDDFDRGYNNYRQCFVGDGSATTYNDQEILFWDNDAKTNVTFNIRHMAPRYGYSEYNQDGFLGDFTPSFDAVELFYSKNGLPMDVDPLTKDRDLYSIYVRDSLINDGIYSGIHYGDTTALLNCDREPRFYASIGYDRGDYDVGGETITLRCLRGEEQQCTADYKTNIYQGATGYFIKKWVSKAATYTASSNKTATVKYAYPYMRLAEMYLNYAEAEAEYTGTLSAKGLEYLNAVRNRAGIPNFEDSWALVGGMPTGDDLIDAIRQERMIEFMFEGRWFHDLRRWKLAEEYYMRKPRGWNVAGTTPEEFYQVVDVDEGSQTRTFYSPRNYWMAVPQDQISINPNLVQNPGYSGGVD